MRGGASSHGARCGVFCVNLGSGAGATTWSSGAALS